MQILHAVQNACIVQLQRWQLASGLRKGPGDLNCILQAQEEFHSE